MNPFKQAIEDFASIDWWGNRKKRYVLDNDRIYDTVRQIHVDPVERLNQHNDFLLDVFQNYSQLIYISHQSLLKLESYQVVDKVKEELTGLLQRWHNFTNDYKTL